MRSAKRTGTYSLKKVFALFIVCVCAHVQISVHVCVCFRCGGKEKFSRVSYLLLPVGFRNKSQTWQQFPLLALPTRQPRNLFFY